MGTSKNLQIVYNSIVGGLGHDIRFHFIGLSKRVVGGASRIEGNGDALYLAVEQQAASAISAAAYEDARLSMCLSCQAFDVHSDALPPAIRNQDKIVMSQLS